MKRTLPRSAVQSESGEEHCRPARHRTSKHPRARPPARVVAATAFTCLATRVPCVAQQVQPTCVSDDYVRRLTRDCPGPSVEVAAGLWRSRDNLSERDHFHIALVEYLDGHPVLAADGKIFRKLQRLAPFVQAVRTQHFDLAA